jgi:hypothetical protein
MAAQGEVRIEVPALGQPPNAAKPFLDAVIGLEGDKPFVLRGVT